MKHYLTIVLFLLTAFTAFSQNQYQIKPENADCSKPIEIKDTLFGPTNAPSGFGSVMEVSGDKHSLYAFEKEHNTVWYFFRAKNDCLLELDIVPVSINDDYDFVLYKYTDKNFCQDVADKKIQPVRTCISRNDKTNGSKTGLSAAATDEFIHSGPGASYSKAIAVRKGEVYYLCVDNVYPNGKGHTVILHYSGCKAPVAVQKTQSKTQVKTTTTVAPKNTIVTLKVVDKDTQKPIKANLKIFDKNKNDTIPLFKYDSVATCKATLLPNVSYVVKSESGGYFDNARGIKTLATGDPITMKIDMSSIKVGQNVVFENILFYAGRADFLPASHAPLEVIAATMKRNPKLQIEIQGHVNCPSTVDGCDKMQEANMELSVNRAKAVYDYLVKVGIIATRMTYKGFGATKMIYPDARSEDKMEKNRRVEIVVTGK